MADLESNSSKIEIVDGIRASSAGKTIGTVTSGVFAAKMKQFVAELKKQGDSVGGMVSCVIRKVPAGPGESGFGKLKAKLAQVVLAICRYQVLRHPA